MEKEQKKQKSVLDGMEMNLSDFALFLSVMRNKEAHEITLSNVC